MSFDPSSIPASQRQRYGIGDDSGGSGTDTDDDSDGGGGGTDDEPHTVDTGPSTEERIEASREAGDDTDRTTDTTGGDGGNGLTGEAARQAETMGYAVPEESGIESGQTPGGNEVRQGLVEQARAFEQQLIEDDPTIRSAADVNIRFRGGELVAERTEPGRQNVVDQQRAAAAEQFDEQTQTDVSSGDIRYTDGTFELREEPVEEEVATQAAGEFEESGGRSLSEALGMRPTGGGDLSAFVADVDPERDVRVETGEGGDVIVTPSDTYLERQLTGQLGIAADTGEDFTVEREDGEVSVGLTAEGRQDAITAELLQRGEIELEGESAELPLGGIDVQQETGESALGIEFEEGEDGAFVIGGGTTTREIESAEQLEFDEEGNLVNVAAAPAPTFDEEFRQLRGMGVPGGAAAGLAGSRAVLRGAGELSTDVGGFVAEGGTLPYTGRDVPGLYDAAEVAGDIADIAGRGAQLHAATDPTTAQFADDPQADAEEALEEGETAVGDLFRGPEAEVGDPTFSEAVTEDFATGAANIIRVGVELPETARVGADVVGQAGAFTIEEVAEEGFVEGGTTAAAAGGEAAVDVGEQVAVQTINEPAQTAGMLIGSGAVFGAARAVGPRTSLGTRVAIQPGEELLGYGGYGLTRRVAGQRAADTFFPNQEPLIFSEEAALRGARRVAGGFRSGVQRIRGGVGEVDTPGSVPGLSRFPNVEVEAGRGVSRGPVEVNVRGDLTSGLVGLERTGRAARTRFQNRARDLRQRFEGESEGGDFTPADLGRPIASGASSAARGTRRAAERATEMPFEAFSRGAEGLRNLEVEAEARAAEGTEGMSELVEESRSAARDMREQPGVLERTRAQLQGDIEAPGQRSFLFDTETRGPSDVTTPQTANPLGRLSYEAVTGAQRGVRRGRELPGEVVSRGAEGLRNLEVEAEARAAEGTEGVSELVEESRSAARDMREQPGSIERTRASLQGEVTQPGERPSFWSDTETRGPSDVTTTPADIARPFATGAQRAVGGIGSLREFGIRVDIGRPGRTARASELEVEGEVGAPFEGDYESGGELYEPPEGAEQPSGPTEIGGGLESFQAEVEVETESGVSVQRVIGSPELEAETESETEPIREAAQPRRFDRVDRLEGEQPLAPELQPQVDELGVGVGELEGEREALAFEPVYELEGRGELEREQELEREAELEREQELELERELERESEFELELESERELERERFPDDQLQDRERDPLPFLGDADDVITEFRNPLTGELIETDAEPSDPSLPFL